MILQFWLVHHTAIIEANECWTVQRLPSSCTTQPQPRRSSDFHLWRSTSSSETRRTLGLTRSRRSYHHTAPFWTSLSRQSVVWRRPSKQIFRGLTYKWGWTTGKKQETVGLCWATFTHSSVHLYVLLQALHRCISSITAAKCASWHRFTQTYLPRCINVEEIEGWKATSQKCKIIFVLKIDSF